MPEEKEDKKPSIMNAVIDIKWLVTLLIPFIAWCVSLEVRMSSGLSQRVTNLEVVLQPVLIDYGIDKQLKERGIRADSLFPAIQPPMASPAPVPRPPRVASEKSEEIRKLRMEEENKLRNQFPNAYEGKK